jgi:hypothetical protein
MAGNNVVSAIGPSYHLDDRKAACQTAVNMYLEAIESNGEPRALNQVSAPGLTLFTYLGAEIRCQRMAFGRWFVVAGNTLYEMVSGAPVSRGTLLTSSGTVWMSNNDTQLAITDGANLHVMVLATNVISRVTVPGWRGTIDMHELDGYTLFVAPDSDQFYISANGDTTTLDPLDFSSADALPDNIVAHKVLHREWFLFGVYSAEVWVNSGDSTFPFARYNSVTLDVGCVGKDAAIVAADSIYWVGQTRNGAGIVYTLNGHSPARVSTRAIEQALAKADLASVKMWSYQVDGHEFIAINAVGMATTLVFDAATQQWHERAEWLDGWFPLRVNSVCFANGVHYAGDARGNLYAMSQTAYAYGNDPMVRERTWPHMTQQSMEPISFFGLELGCTTGYGGNVTLQISNDGGYTFGPPLLKSLGAIGRFMQRVRWNSLGTARDRVFRIRCSDAVPFNIHAATVVT